VNCHAHIETGKIVGDQATERTRGCSAAQGSSVEGMTKALAG